MIVIENYLAPDQLRTIRDERYWQEPWAGRYVIQENWNIATDTYMFHHFAQEMFLVGAKKHPMLMVNIEKVLTGTLIKMNIYGKTMVFYRSL